MSLVGRLVILAALLTVLLLNTDSVYQTQVYSNSAFGNSRSIGPITAANSYQQPLLFNRDISRITSFSIMFATYGRPDYADETERIEVSLSDGDGQVLFTEEVIVGTLEDNQYRTFVMDEPIQVDQGSYLYVTVRGIDTTTDNAPTIWLSRSTEQSCSDMTFLDASMSEGRAITGSDGFFCFSVKAANLRSDQVLILGVLYAAVIALLLLKIIPGDKKYRLAPVIRSSSMLLGFLLSYYIVIRLALGENIRDNIWNNILPLITFLLIFVVISLISDNGTTGLALTQIIMFGLAVIQDLKMEVRGDAFLPTDYFAAAEAATIVTGNNITLALSYNVITAFILLILITLLTYRTIRSTKHKAQYRLAAAAPLTVLLIVSLPLVHTNHDFLKKTLLIQNINWAPTQNVEVNGFFESFLMNSDVLMIRKPDSYSKKTVDSILLALADNMAESAENVSQDNVSASTDTLNNIPDNVSVKVPVNADPTNVIFIMDESFYDLRVLDDEFSGIDIMPYYDSLTSESIYGKLLVPTFAGGTCNTEFEVLTGFSDYFYSTGALPYQQYIHQQINAIPAVFGSQGYRSVAVHPNDPSFWNRKIVYDLLGFDKFLSIGSFTDAQEVNRGMFSDKSVYDVILTDIASHDQSEFVFAVTIQNHTPYTLTGTEAVYGLHSDKYDSTPLDNYMNLIRQSDEDLKYLIENLRTLDEKTVVVFFGDHAPSLGGDFFDAFQDNAVAKYSTPYLIWANYDNAFTPGQESLSANYLAPFVLEQIGLDCDPWSAYLNQLRKEIPMISQIGIVDNQGIFHPNTGENESVELARLLENYYTLQYDLLVKENYFESYYEDYYGE